MDVRKSIRDLSPDRTKVHMGTRKNPVKKVQVTCYLSRGESCAILQPRATPQRCNRSFGNSKRKADALIVPLALQKEVYGTTSLRIA
ncbi:hypothetical protein SUGI_0026390 [Cryptomeria japonica]|nr:hypothetical protein SUGI_0026390 [Cryptomeria japonica]